MRQLRKTSPNSSYRTLVNGGYIINISPMAMGTDVEPMDSDSETEEIPGQKCPALTPMAMAKNIQTVR